MSPCTCKPGTKENGWHEERCVNCTLREIEAFGKAVKRVRAAMETHFGTGKK